LFFKYFEFPYSATVLLNWPEYPVAFKLGDDWPKTLCLKPRLLSRGAITVKSILKNYSKMVVFGSRIKGTSKRLSDLDVCLKDKILDSDYELLKEKFEKSDLPFKVDLVEYR